MTATPKYFKRPLQPGGYALADLISSYWVNFAKTGAPNAPGLRAWPAFDEQGANVTMFDVQSRAIKFSRKEAMDFLFDKLK